MLDPEKGRPTQLNIALSVEALTPVLTGIGRYTWELVQGLAQAEPVSVKFYHQKRWLSEPGNLLKQRSSHSDTRHKKLFLKKPSWYKNWELRNACKDLLFHGPNYFVPECSRVSIATVHDLSIFKYPETHPTARLRHFDAEFKRSMSRVSHLITDSTAIRDEVIDYLGWPPNKITAVPLGVSTAFRPRSAVDLVDRLRHYALSPGCYSLCVSTLEPRKRVDKLLQAFGRLPLALKLRYPLVLIGSAGWLSETLLAEIDRLLGTGWLCYLGFVPEDDLPYLYAGARGFFFPSVYEGFGLPVLEAMASGVPVVTSNRSSLPEVTAGAALLVDPDDVESLSDSIVRSLTDDPWRKVAIARGKAVAEAFTWARCLDETTSVYAKVWRNAEASHG